MRLAGEHGRHAGRPVDGVGGLRAAIDHLASARPGRIRLHGRVAFAADRHRNVDLYLVELPAGRVRRLTTSPAADLSPTWAPDGRRLASALTATATTRSM